MNTSVTAGPPRRALVTAADWFASGHRIPIVALTADALSGSRERCMASGMDDYLTKPVSFASLREAVERWTRHRVPVAE